MKRNSECRDQGQEGNGYGEERESVWVFVLEFRPEELIKGMLDSASCSPSSLLSLSPPFSNLSSLHVVILHSSV